MLKVTANKQFANFNLRLDLELESGFNALFGPSGAGKTCTLNLIAGLLRPDAGEIALHGRTLYSTEKGINVRPRDRDLGYIFQESRLFPHLSVEQNLAFALRNVPKPKRRFNLPDIVEVTGLQHLRQRMPDALSGGERQRVALARALLASPAYLLMDEPLAALDQTARLAFLTFLKNIHARLEIPILYVTHDLASVVNFAHQVVLLKSGQQIAVGEPLVLLAKMAAPPLISQEDITNIFEAEVIQDDADKGITVVRVNSLEFILPRLEVPPGKTVLLNIPASEIILSVDTPTGLSASNILQGEIVAIHHIKERVLVNIMSHGLSFTVEIVEGTVKRLELKTGRQVFLIFKASSFRRLR